ncbi:Twin-arginine translocation pathway signal [Streptomyces sp. NBC_01190]|uniref:Twin-arginine translocation pathway signal n=1 Tax=Streptomyces sp. NBC_01190 TaxID=2903767 RepID=UPI003869D931|nr:tetratricopeptide repeat protein [Streptomyces sp. NBC_01190]
MTISRSRRAIIKRAATQIRVRCRSYGHDVQQTADVIRTELPEVQPLEAWRFALGWPRSRTIERVGALYRSRGLLPPGLSESMLCRWEHRPYEKPSPEYVEALCAVYQALPRQLGLERGAAHEVAGWGHATRYSASGPTTRGLPARESVVLMTTSAGLPAVRESLHLALLADPAGSSTVTSLSEAAIEHYALGYSKHPPHVLFNEVHAVRGLLTQALTNPLTPQPIGVDLRRSLGWLSALLGNLAFHLGDATGARVHFGTAATYGDRAGDGRLTAWAWGAQAMVARSAGKHTLALDYAERGLACAPSGLPHVQLLAWAQLPSLAALGRERPADAALADATRELEADAQGWAPGRFGYDIAEHSLHEADAQRTLGRAERAAASAEQSLRATTPGTPGWAAASLALAQVESSAQPSDAAQRAAEVLDRVPSARLRATSRDRLAQLGTALGGTGAAGAEDLRERLRLLPPLIDASGVAASA